jgi:hypothetical protein
MSQIHFRRFRPINDDGWELDCFILPDDKINGELVHFKLKKIQPFRGEVEPGLFATLTNLIDRVPSRSETAKTEARLVIGRMKEGTELHYFLRAAEKYPQEAPETEIWKLVDAIYEKRLKGAGHSQ